MASWPMPVVSDGKNNNIFFNGVFDLLSDIKTKYKDIQVYLERAIPLAMGSKHAFNYGRGFAAIEIAISMFKMPAVYVDPQKWAKEMHEGISKDLKPKAKSVIAVNRLYPELIHLIPKNKKGVLSEGCVDALLIAGYGLRKI